MAKKTTKKEQIEYIINNYYGVAEKRVGKWFAKRGKEAVIHQLQYHVLKEEINVNYEALKNGTYHGWIF